MKRIAMLITAATLTLAACSDDKTTTPTTSDSYLVTTGGSSFIYQTDDLSKKSAGTGDSVTATQQDSMVVSPTKKTMDGKQAVEYITYTDGVATDTTYYAEENGKQYAYVDIASGSPIPLGTKWLLIGDQNGTTWESYKADVPPTSVNLTGTPQDVYGTVTITGKKIGSENITVNGTAVNCIHYSTTITMALKTDVELLGTIRTIDIPISLVQNVWLGKNYGLVKAYMPPTTVGVPSLFEYELDGSMQTMLRANIK